MRRHADAVVADGQGAPLRIGLDSDAEVLPLEAHVLIRQGPNNQWGYGSVQLMQSFHLMREL